MKISNSLSFIKENNLVLDNYICSSLYSSIYKKINQKKNITFYYFEENPYSDQLFIKNIKLINPEINIIYYPKSTEGLYVQKSKNLNKVKIFESFDCSSLSFINFSKEIDKKNKKIYFQHKISNPILDKFNKFPFEISDNCLTFLESNIYSINKKDFSNNIFKLDNFLALKDSINIYFHLLDLKKILIGKQTFNYINKKDIESNNFYYINKNIPEIIKNRLIELNQNTMINPMEGDYIKENHFFSGEGIRQLVIPNNFYKLGQYMYIEIEENKIPTNINFLFTEKNDLYIENIKKINNNKILLQTSLISK